MATVGTHQRGAFSTPVNGATADASVVLSNDNSTLTTTNAHDADASIHVQSSVLASRPAASVAGQYWVTSDGLRAYLDSGSAWGELAYLPIVGGTVTGATTFSAGLTTTTITATTSVVGPLATAAQPNVTSVGTLTSLAVSGAGTISGVFTYTKQYASTRVALTDAATIAVDWNNGNVQAVTLGGNRTFTFANPIAGGRYVLVLAQDATGSRTVTWPTIKWAGGTAPTLTLTAGKKDVVTVLYDGTDYIGTAVLNA